MSQKQAIANQLSSSQYFSANPMSLFEAKNHFQTPSIYLSRVFVRREFSQERIQLKHKPEQLRVSCSVGIKFCNSSIAIQRYRWMNEQILQDYIERKKKSALDSLSNSLGWANFLFLFLSVDSQLFKCVSVCLRTLQSCLRVVHTPKRSRLQLLFILYPISLSGRKLEQSKFEWPLLCYVMSMRNFASY